MAKKDFQCKEEACSIAEVEELRLALNDMSTQLKRMHVSQETFFQNVSHELRTPLMSISGYAQRIQHGVFPDAAKSAGLQQEFDCRYLFVVNMNAFLHLTTVQNTCKISI